MVSHARLLLVDGRGCAIGEIDFEDPWSWPSVWSRSDAVADCEASANLAAPRNAFEEASLKTLRTAVADVRRRRPCSVEVVAAVWNHWIATCPAEINLGLAQRVTARPIVEWIVELYEALR